MKFYSEHSAQSISAEEFWSKVNIGGEDECWPCSVPKLYPVSEAGYQRSAQRIAYVFTNGPIEKGSVYRTCDTKHCCNPKHLFLKTDTKFKVGDKYHKLTLLGPATDTDTPSLWRAQCDCGETIVDSPSSFYRGDIRSCITCRPRKYEGLMANAYCIYQSRYDDGDITFEQFLEMSQLSCHYCGRYRVGCKSNRYRGKWYYNGLDRVSNKKGHYLDDCVTCCYDCNRWKAQHSAGYLVEHAGRIYAHQEKKAA